MYPVSHSLIFTPTNEFFLFSKTAVSKMKINTRNTMYTALQLRNCWSTGYMYIEYLDYCFGIKANKQGQCDLKLNWMCGEPLFHRKQIIVNHAHCKYFCNGPKLST